MLSLHFVWKEDMGATRWEMEVGRKKERKREGGRERESERERGGGEEERGGRRETQSE